MPLVDVLMPKLGESIMEATILKWHKKIGESIKQDENLLDIATDKVDSEVPCTAEGIVEALHYAENDVVPIGKAIATIRVGSTEDATPNTTTTTPPEQTKIDEAIPYTPTQTVQAETNTTATNTVGAEIRFYSPLVLNIAQQEGISISDLQNIAGTGQDGRVSKKDILLFVANKATNTTQGISNNTPTQQATIVTTTQVPPQTEASVIKAQPNFNTPTIFTGNVEIIEMDRMRKLIAKHMVDSKHTSPHVTSFAECDVTSLVMWREKVKKDFEKREGEKITFTPLFIEAIVKCIKKYPMISSSVDGDRIIIKKDLGIGMATALPSGNLIVPVIKNADQLNLVGLTKQVNGLANAARTGKLKPDDTTGGTFTLTNVGTFGSIMGTPIINQPQVAIMAVGAIKKRPMVIETPQGDSIAIRHMMYISLSYDHRIIDGALGSTFLNAVSKELENFDGDRNI
jgi:2-oxoglutarate dehydrogenase E2 component (dihydrolipoamide succinyltransferase)